MLTFILRRLAYSVVVLVIASFIIFSLVSLAGDPTAALRMNPDQSEQTIELMIARKHLDEPIPVRYVYWVQEAFTQGFGTTIVGDQKIWPDLKRAMGHTLQLVIAAEIVAIVVALLIGVYSALRQYSRFDYAATTFSFIGIATPVFWLALMLQVLFVNIYLSFDVRIFYTSNLSSVDPGSGLAFVVDRAQHLALPVIVLSIANIATYSRYTRATMLEVINSDYIRTARAKGLSERKVVIAHAFRNTLIPIVTLMALQFGALIGGAVVTETVFALDGMGLYFVNSLVSLDPYPVMAWLMVTSVMVVIFNLIADIAYGSLDPRVRYD